MDLTYRFRRSMVRRLLDAAGVAALTVPALYGAACGGKVVVDGATGGGVGGEGGGADTSGTISGLVTSTSTGGDCELTSSGVTTGSGNPQTQVTSCFQLTGSKCPNQYQAIMFISPSTSCNYVVSVDCGPVQDDGDCCYLVTEEGGGCVGRPFLVEGGARTARAGEGDRGWALGVLAPAAEGLDPAVRAALADAWTADALLEHASVASFSRFSLELMAVGAPADLVAAAHQAALDEVRHARVCFALAQGYRGAPLGPTPFPFGGAILVSADLAEVAVAAAREGCVGETLAAVLAAEQLARAADPAVRRALSAIAEDESRHAELAWRTVAWAIERGGEPVRAAVEAAFAEAARHVPSPRLATGVDPALLAEHGHLDAASLHEAAARALAEVIVPCAAALLRRSSPQPVAAVAA